MLNREELIEQVKERAKLGGVLITDSYLDKKTYEELEKFAKQLKVCINKGKYTPSKFKLPRGHTHVQLKVSNGKIV